MNRADRWILTLALIGLGGCGGAQTPPPDAPTGTPPAQAQLAPVPDFHDYVVGNLPKPASSARDPFGANASEPRQVAPTRTRTPSTPNVDLRLQGILRKDGRLVAFLGRTIVAPGDLIEGWTVVEIDERSVLLERNGKQRRLSL
jgi:hypothetical protein